LAAGSTGQEPQPGVEVESAPADKALAAWNKAKGTKQKNAALLRLGKLSDPRITDLLLSELERAGNGKYAVTVLRAINGHPRSEVLGPVRDVLERSSSPTSLKNSAAVALARQGNRAVDSLVAIASDDRTEVKVYNACLHGLAAADDARAWRGLARFALRGSARSRLAVLELMDDCRDVRAVTQVRLKLLKDSDAAISATAWRQLAVQGHDRAVWAFDDLIEKHGRKPPVPVRVQLVAGLPYILERGHFECMLQLAASQSSTVRKELRAVASRLGKRADFVDWLLNSALQSSDAAEREVAMIVLKAAPATSVRGLVARVRKNLRKSTGRSSLDLVIALNDLLAKDPSWKDDLKGLANSRDAAVRTVGLSLLLEVGGAGAVGAAQRGIDHKSWQLRSISYRYLTKFRDVASIPKLIARTDREHGRLEGELGDALFVHTGVRCWKRSEWDAWWRKNQEGHQLPAWQSVSAVAKNSSSGGTMAYYGIPLASKRVAFLIDVSGSMKAKIGTGRKRSRLDGAKQQLGQVIEKMAKDYEFNVITYQTTVRPVWGGLRRAAGKNKAEMQATALQLKAGGGTNIYGALEQAFADPDVDTVYLLSDGEPSGGLINDIDEIGDAVRRWNYQRQVIIHGIAIGKKSRLLKRLADESGGQYVVVNR